MEKTTKYVIISITSITVITILYLAFQKRKEQNIIKENQLQKDFDKVISQIDKVKK